jgi:hypothetical protein
LAEPADCSVDPFLMQRERNKSLRATPEKSLREISRGEFRAGK